jgi:hypothetical protein
VFQGETDREGAVAVPMLDAEGTLDVSLDIV